MHRFGIFLFILTGIAFSQPAAPKPAFEIADVHPAPPGFNGYGQLTAGRTVELRGSNLVHLISLAYDIPQDRVFGGLRWLDTERFDVLAKPSEPAQLPELRAMLRNLLADRFQLKAHQEDRPSPIYALTRAKKGLLIKPAAGEITGQCVPVREPGVTARTCHGITLASLAQQLRSMAPAYFDRPVVDRTGAEGVFEFTLKWTPRGGVNPNIDAVPLFDYMEKELGIKVESTTMPMASIIVDSVDRKPTDNAPGAADAFRPLPTEFDVAEIHASKPDATSRMSFNIDHGRVEILGLNLKVLINLAYNTTGEITGGESWMNTDRFDVIAKTDPIVTFDGIRPMMRKLLEDRMKLVTHMQDQPTNVYGLVAGSHPKLKEGDLNGRQFCKSANEGALRTITCVNTTMEEFVGRLRVPGVDRPVIDMTGLKGAYDFAVSWNSRVTLGTPGRGAVADTSQPAATPTAADPSGGPTIMEALEKQLGLKLVPQKHDMPSLVIDKASRTPVDN